MKRSFVGRYFELVLDGSESAGFVASVDYGGIKGELLAQPVGGAPLKVKHVHNPTVEPVTVKMGLSMSKDVFDWIERSWKGECVRKNGSIITYDHDLKQVYEYQFYDALILEMTVPTLDASSKDPFYITLKFQAERAEHKWGAGGRSAGSRLPTRQKIITPSNFILEIEGMTIDRVSKIDQFVVKQNVKPLSCGADWMYQIEPTSLEYPNLTATLSIVNSAEFINWHKDFVIDGNNGPEKEKTGAIVMLAQDMSTELMTVTLKQMGICNLALEKADAGGADAFARVKVDLYCEEMELKWESAGKGGGSAA